MGMAIRDITVVDTAPEGINLQVVKVETTEPGLCGLGCSTFAYRADAVRTTIETYLRPLLIGRDASDIRQLWDLMHFNSYWRCGPIENCAISGIDMALWDIKGKVAHLPLYSLLGGRARAGVPVYRHANGSTIEELIESIEMYRALGVRVIRCQMNGYGGGEHGPAPATAPDNSMPGVYLDPHAYIDETLHMFDEVTSRFGRSVRFVHDTHERLDPTDALAFAKQMETYDPLFLEDVLPMEQLDWYEELRAHTTVALAEGELFGGPHQWKPLIERHLIDYVRAHISQLGGITPALKLMSFAELHGVKIAWHGPGDLSPVGHAVNIHLDLTASNLGIQEWSGIEPPNFVIQKLSGPPGALLDVFDGLPEYRDGYVYATERPGIGIEIDEKAAARYPARNCVTTWTQTRRPDGSIQAP